MSQQGLGEHVVRTRISKATIELMAEKPFDEITITELARRAQVARVSFYRNYSCKEDVLREIMEGQTSEFLSKWQGVRSTDPRAYTVALLAHLHRNRHQIGLLMRSNRMDLLRAEFDRAFTVEGVEQSEATRRWFYAGGLYNLFCHWADEGYRESPEALADAVFDLVR